jgi:NADPH:quinone reductase-like Zn-dependent oxidoreductase
MRSIVCTAYGTDDNFVLEEVITPDPAPGQVRIAVKTALRPGR